MSERIDGNRLAAWLLIAAFIAVLNFAAFASSKTASTPSDALLFRWSFAVGGAVLLGIMIAISLAISNGRPALRAIRSSRITLPAMIGLGLLAIAGVYVASLLVTSLGGNPAREQGLVTEHWQSGRVAPFIASVLVLTVLTPIAEELFIRGIGFGLLEPLGRVASIAGPALVWALMHGLPAAIFPLFAFGIGIGYLRERSGSTIPGMFVHGLYNGVALALAFTA
ncbi:MAG: type II CAAX endopeptidase family protein [Gaiellaceae bacterium]|jgi:membrane protease YdiL (CAAX protease family)